MKKLKKLSAFIFALGMLSVTTLPYSVSALENTVTSDNPISEEAKEYPKNWTYYKTVSDEEVYEEYKNYWISHGYGERYNWDDKDSVIQSFFSALKNDNTTLDSSNSIDNQLIYIIAISGGILAIIVIIVVMIIVKRKKKEKAVVTELENKESEAEENE
jgi:ABC-type antimicrobial peptide transport system permease subunit